jgi:hypothetical protein
MKNSYGHVLTAPVGSEKLKIRIKTWTKKRKRIKKIMN